MSSPRLRDFSSTICISRTMMAPIACCVASVMLPCFVGFGAIEDGVGVAAQLFAGLHREPEHLGDHHHRQVGGELGDDVDLTLVACAVEHAGGDVAHLGLEVGDRPRGEEARHELAVPAVARLVAADEHVVALVVALDGHAVARHEGAGVEVRAEHVVEAGERPEPDLLVLVHGRFVAQPLVRGVRVGLDVTCERVVLHGRLPLERRVDGSPYVRRGRVRPRSRS